MRPEKAKYLVSKAIEHYYRTGDPFKLYDAKKAIIKLNEYCRKEWDADKYGPYEYLNITDKDFSPDAVLNTVHYISDRFMAPHRIQWLLMGVNDNKFVTVQQ